MFSDKVNYLVSNKTGTSRGTLLIELARKPPVLAEQLGPALNRFIKQLKTTQYSCPAGKEGEKEHLIQHINFPMESGMIAKDLDRELIPRLEISFVNTLGRAEFLEIQKVPDADRWTVSITGGGMSKGIASLEIKDGNLSISWAAGVKDSLEKIKHIAAVTLMTISAKDDKGERLPAQRFQFLRPIELKPTEFKAYEFMKETRKDDAGFDLVSAELLAMSAALLGEPGTNIDVQMRPARIAPKDLKLKLEAGFDMDQQTKKLSFEPQQVFDHLPILTLKDWKPGEAIQFQMSPNWSKATVPLKVILEEKEDQDWTKEQKAYFKRKVVSLLVEIHKALAYEVKPRLIVKGPGGELLLAAPRDN
jgi:hypothetical protein